MLKKIPTTQLRLGMHLHAFEGSWINHPFWKTRFVIDEAALLDRVRESGVSECWIDVSKGADVAEDDRPSPMKAAPAAIPATAAHSSSAHHAPSPSPQGAAASLPRAAPAPAAPAAPREPSTPMAEELQRAAAVCKRGRQAVTQMFNEARMGRAIDAEQCLPLVDEVSNSVMRNPGALVSLARLKTQDEYTFMHSVAVCALMVAVGRQLGMDDTQCREAGLAGMLHDLGKSLVPLDLLNKPGKLTDEEFAIIRTHPERGHALLVEGKGAAAGALDVCLHHHEKMDGSGYPHHLPGEQISLLARMAAVCDVYDAITSNRPYKAGWDPAESVARMASWKGHFDETVFKAFVQSLGIYPTGSVVRLESQRLAVVLEQSPGSLVAPVVKAFFSLKSQMPIPPVRIELASPKSNDRIVARASADDWQGAQIDDLWIDPEVRRRTR
jgi:HD-GYP domain-containing protein (c-di-GMP phosphodiesterase class II)